jgi:hypothetical protein
MATVFEPIRPVPPIATILIVYPPLSTPGDSQISSNASDVEPGLEARGLDNRAHVGSSTGTVSLATSKLYTRAVLTVDAGDPRTVVPGRLGLFVVRHHGQDLARLGKGRLAVRVVRAPDHVVDGV